MLNSNLRRFLLFFGDSGASTTEQVTANATQDAVVGATFAWSVESIVPADISAALSIADVPDLPPLGTAPTAGYGLSLLVELFFTTGTLRYTTAPVPISPVALGGNTFSGYGPLVSVSAFNESEDSSAHKVDLTMSIVNTAMLAAVQGSAETYRRRKVKIYVQLHDENFKPVGDPKLRWTGVMNRIGVQRKPAAALQGASGVVTTGKITMECLRVGMDRYRNSEGLRISDAQHQAKYPNDLIFSRMTSLIEKPALWLSKKFQEI